METFFFCSSLYFAVWKLKEVFSRWFNSSIWKQLFFLMIGKLLFTLKIFKCFLGLNELGEKLGCSHFSEQWTSWIVNYIYRLYNRPHSHYFDPFSMSVKYALFTFQTSSGVLFLNESVLLTNSFEKTVQLLDHDSSSFNVLITDIHERWKNARQLLCEIWWL